ncbi:MAG: Rpn family recombination-promoting nuclease/putative transposase [Candidatus Competibacter sp.]
MKTDNLFYRLFKTLPTLVLELAGITVDNPDGYAFRAEEVKQTAFRLDGLLMPPPDAPDAPLVFLEAQAQPDEDFYGRFFSEIFLYLYRSVPRRPWRALVIYPQRAMERLDFRYAELLALPLVQRVYLEDLATFPTPSLGLQLLQLLVASPDVAVRQAQHLARHARTESIALPLRQIEFLDLIETILVYRLPQLTRQEIQTMLGLTHAELQKSRFYQEVFAEGRQEGRQEGHQEGRQEGHQEGRQEGRQEESVALVLRLLQRRFGALPASQEHLIRRLSLAQTEALAEALLDFQTIADLTAWLAAQ